MLRNNFPLDWNTLVLTRTHRIDKSVMGMIYLRGVFLCDTLENADYLIACGDYGLQNTYSPKFKANRYEIINVPNRSRLLIHEGNYATDSTGCVLVGICPSFDSAYLQSSVLTLKRVMNTIRETNSYFFKIFSLL